MLAKDYTFTAEKSSHVTSQFGYPDYLYRTMTMDTYNNLEKDFYQLRTPFYNLIE